MDTNKILSSNLLDLLFEGRNKAYGAYDLRITYPQRIKKSLLITASIALLAFTGSVLARNLKPSKTPKSKLGSEVTIQDLKDDKKPEPIPEKKPEPVQVKTEKLAVKIVPDEKATDPPPDVDDIKDAKIDVFKQDGDPYDSKVVPKDIDDGKGIIDAKKDDEPDEPFTKVEIDAKFSGDWEKFLKRNLNPEVPVNNGATAGRYTVVIQFVVDKEGNVSDIQPITNIGFGMEQEAVRVLKKAAKWEPAIQAGMKVKAYRRQQITFEVVEE